MKESKVDILTREANEAGIPVDLYIRWHLYNTYLLNMDGVDQYEANKLIYEKTFVIQINFVNDAYLELMMTIKGDDTELMTIRFPNTYSSDFVRGIGFAIRAFAAGLIASTLTASTRNVEKPS